LSPCTARVRARRLESKEAALTLTHRQGLLRFGSGTTGAWDFPLSCVARAPTSSPATGSHASHQLEQKMLIDEAFA
jgi:hypothetical protein